MVYSEEIYTGATHTHTQVHNTISLKPEEYKIGTYTRKDEF